MIASAEISGPRLLVWFYLYQTTAFWALVSLNSHEGFAVGYWFLSLLWPLYVTVGPLLDLVTMFSSGQAPMFVMDWGFGSYTAWAMLLLISAVPFITVLSFLIEDDDGVPYAFYWLEFFLPRSAAKHLSDDNWDVAEFERAIRKRKYDRHMARMEIVRLRKMAAEARARTSVMDGLLEKRLREKEDLLRAAIDAMNAAEDRKRAAARERASRRK